VEVFSTYIYWQILAVWMTNSGTKSVKNPYILVVKISMKILLTNHFPNKMSDTEMPEQFSLRTVTHLHWGYLLGG
jgi:hypothetical protein